MNRGCPRCAVELETHSRAGVEVDVCTMCDGIFLDEGEFDTLIAERFEKKRLESTFELIADAAEDPLFCSSCNTAMFRLDYDELELDRCPQCGGIWIDGHEGAEFAERAKASQREPDLDAFVVCSGCGNGELQRLCIKRMDAFWCEACVVAGNHPGPEAQQAKLKQMQREAFAQLAREKARQETLKDAVATRRERRHYYGNPHYHQNRLFFDLVESVARSLVNLFSSRTRRRRDDD